MNCVQYFMNPCCLLWLVPIILGSGCALQSYPSQSRKFYDLYRSGRATEAAVVVSGKAEKKGDSRDALLWRLEEGSVLLAAADFDGSLRALEAAEAVLSKYEEKATVSAGAVAREGAALITNTTAIPYYGRGYDKIMLNTYKALAYARSGRLEDARVEMRRAYARQQEEVEKHARTIARAQERMRSEEADPEEVLANPRVQSQMTEHYGDLDKLEPYAVYVNPFTVYLDGLLHLASSGNSDLERAKKDFERVLGMTDAKDLLAFDIQSVEKRYADGRISPTVYVVVENGMAPIRKEISFFLPVILPVPQRGGKVAVYGDYAAASFPRLEFQPAPYAGFTVRVDGQDPVRTRLLANMDAIIGREFRHELPIIILRTLAATATRGVARHYAGKEAGIWAELTLLFYDILVARADLRTWLTLPKEFQFARFPAPAARQFSLADERGQNLVTVALPEAEMTLVYVKTPSRGAVSVQVIKLR